MALPGVQSIRYAAIDNAAATGNTTVVAATTGKRVVVVGYAIVASGAVAVKFTDGAGGTNLTGAMALAANGGVSYAGDITTPALAASVGNALVLNAGGAVQVSGHIAYYLSDK